jgi:hypothetical protein
MRRAPIAIAIVLTTAALIAWRGRNAGSPFEFAGVRPGVDLKQIAETFSSPERLDMECQKRGDRVHCGTAFGKIGGHFYAVLDQDRQVNAILVIPGRGSPELPAELARVKAAWQPLPHRTVAVPVEHVGDTIATRWTSKDQRWSATITEGGAAEGMPGYVMLLDEKHARPADRDALRFLALSTVAHNSWRRARAEASEAWTAELFARER